MQSQPSSHSSSEQKTLYDRELKKLIVDEAIAAVKGYLKSSAFTDVKLTDTPNDANQVVSRKYVTLNGTSANRPRTSILGQYYFDTTINIPIWWRGDAFVDAAGNVV